MPKDEAAAVKAWTTAKTAAEAKDKPLGGMPRHGQIFAGDPNGDAKAKKPTTSRGATSWR